MATPVLKRPPARPRRQSGIPTRLAGPPPWWRSQPVLKVLILIAAAGDLANFYITVSLAFDAPPIANIILVAAVTAISLGLAHKAGAGWRDHKEAAPARLGLPELTSVITLWLIVGLGAFWVRAITPAAVSSTANEQQFGSGTAPTAPSDTSTAHWGAAIFLLAVYLASGAFAAWHAYNDHDPQLLQLRGTWRRLMRAGRDDRHARDLVEHNASMLRQSHDEGYRLERNFQAALAARQGLADECKQLTRVRIAENQKDPTDTNLLTSQHSASQSAPRPPG